MFININLNIDIQRHYFVILKDFLEAEYKAMEYGEMPSVLELSRAIHGMLETLRAKRAELSAMLEGLGVLEYASELPKNMGDELRAKLDLLKSVEERCAMAASRNSEFAFILADESAGLLGMLPASGSVTGSVSDHGFKGRVQ